MRSRLACFVVVAYGRNSSEAKAHTIGRSGTIFHALPFKLCLMLGGIYEAARKAKPSMVGFPAGMKAVDAILGAKGRSPPVVADQPKFSAAHGAGFY
ncbi:hypothetical protein [Bradyrhizobium sp. DASA03007]|uniref:hypothetical protein n=1 Tax=unclassified Bradyrhizobium TaxID=2631580 RepID=UPI003F703FB9